MMKRMGNMDPSKMNPANPMGALSGSPVKQKKGKGKRRGGFRF